MFQRSLYEKLARNTEVLENAFHSCQTKACTHISYDTYRDYYIYFIIPWSWFIVCKCVWSFLQMSQLEVPLCWAVNKGLQLLLVPFMPIGLRSNLFLAEELVC